MKFQKELESVKEGDEVVIHFDCTALRLDDMASELPRDKSQLLSLFIHGMFFVKPVQHQIRGFSVELHHIQVRLHFLQLLTSLQLPSLSYLHFGYSDPLQRVLKTPPIQAFVPINSTKIAGPIQFQTPHLVLPNITWLDDTLFKTSSTSSLRIPARDLSQEKWVTALSCGLCRNLKYLDLVDLKLPLTLTDTNVKPVSLPDLQTLTIGETDFHSLTNVMKFSSFPSLWRLRIDEMTFEDGENSHKPNWSDLDLEKKLPSLREVSLTMVYFSYETLRQILSEFIALRTLEKMDLKYETDDFDFELFLTLASLVLSTDPLPYESFLDIIEVISPRCPPSLLIEPRHDRANLNVFNEDEFDASENRTISIPSLTELCIKGFGLKHLQDFLFRLKAPSLDRVTIKSDESDAHVGRWRSYPRVIASFPSVRHLSINSRLKYLMILYLPQTFPNLTTIKVEVTDPYFRRVTKHPILNMLRPSGSRPFLPLLNNIETKLYRQKRFRSHEIEKTRRAFCEILELRTRSGCIPLQATTVEWVKGAKSCALLASACDGSLEAPESHRAVNLFKTSYTN